MTLHVYPLRGWSHILHGLWCWCLPYRDPREPDLIIHRAPARA